MTPHEEKKIIQWGNGLDSDVTITLNLTGDKRSDDLRMFCNELAGLASKVSISEVKHEDGEMPSVE